MARAARSTAAPQRTRTSARTSTGTPLASASGRVLSPWWSRSLWVAAASTGIGAAVVAAMVAVVAVAVLWLPAAGGTGRAGSVVRAGLITFVAGVHGGVTVDGLDASFLPLGLLLAVALVCRRAGRGLADAVLALGESDPSRLVAAAALQAVSFAVTAAVFAAASTLGTSGASVPGALAAGVALFAVSGSVVLVGSTSLAGRLAAALPAWAGPGARIAAVVAATYLGAGALLAALSVIVHHHQVAHLSALVGGGWSGLPVLLLGVLAVPNVAVAGAAYLAGPGFAVGSGTAVTLGSSPHGRLPDFPVLGALPTGPAPWIVWLLAAVTPLLAGAAAARVAARTERPWPALGAGAGACALLGFVLAWQGGGGIGSGRLHAVGASLWQFGLVVAAGAGAAGAIWLGLGRAVPALRARGRDAEPDGRLGALVATISATVEAAATEVKLAADAKQNPAPSSRPAAAASPAAASPAAASPAAASPAAASPAAPGRKADEDGQLAG